jgi:hypothetical protein
MQALTMFRIVAKESMTGSGTISDSGSISIIRAWFMAPPLLLLIVD